MNDFHLTFAAWRLCLRSALIGCTALAAIAAQAAAQPFAGCGGLINNNFTILQELRLDNGGPAEALSGIAAPSVSHANRFTLLDPVRLTHVCFASRRLGPSIATGPLFVKIYEGDRQVGGRLQPGELRSQTRAASRSSENAGFALITLNQPVEVSGTVWIVVEFPQPQWATMGVNASSAQSAHVGVETPSGEEWFAYDQAPDPPFSIFFRGYRPIIRGFALEPNPCLPGNEIQIRRPAIPLTTELGDLVSFDVRLNGPFPPTSAVQVSVSSSDPGEGRILQAGRSLTFTPDNWFTVQTVTVQGIDDTFADGDVSYQVDLVAQSADFCFNRTAPASVQLANKDDETAASYVIPFVQAGGNTRSLLLLTHVVGSAWNGLLKFRQGQEAPWTVDAEIDGVPVTGSDLPLQVRPRNTRKIVVTGGTSLESGYLEVVEASGGSVGAPFFNNLFAPPNAAAGFFIEDQSGPDLTAEQPAVRGRFFSLPVEVKTNSGSQINTLLAISPYLIAREFQMLVRLKEVDGTVVSEKPFTFKGASAISVTDRKLFETYFKGHPDFDGTLEIESEHAVALSALRKVGNQTTGIPVAASDPKIAPIP